MSKPRELPKGREKTIVFNFFNFFNFLNFLNFLNFFNFLNFLNFFIIGTEQVDGQTSLQTFSMATAFHPREAR